MSYLGDVLSSAFSIIFFIAVIAALGYLVGGINIKGISLGTAGVLLVALLFGVFASYVPSFEVGGHTTSLYPHVNQPGTFTRFAKLTTS